VNVFLKSLLRQYAGSDFDWSIGESKEDFFTRLGRFLNTEILYHETRCLANREERPCLDPDILKYRVKTALTETRLA
jgi:hypothetical protein